MSEKNFAQYISELSINKNSERQQAIIRIGFAAFFLVFFSLFYTYGWHGGVTGYILIPAVAFLVVSIALFTSINYFPESRVIARKIGMGVDLTITTICVLMGGAAGALGYGGYLWVTIAYGLRYGVQYLKVAHAISLVSFSAVLMVTDYWHQNIVLGVGLLLWLLLLPIYVSKLLVILENTLHAANEANQAKSTFLANMSHEIRTPLTAIIGYAEVSLDGSQTLEERSTALKTIARSGNHLLTIINDILDFSKIEANQLDVEMMPVDLFQIVFDVESVMKSQAEKKGLKLKFIYEFPLPTSFSTDPVRLKQILLNLCSNAIKFTEKGSITVGVSCDGARHVMQFSVKDTGIGMTEKQKKKLFKPFQQADNSITRRFGGTGLGLSLSKRLAEKLGGSIKVESEYGEGACFTLSVNTGSLLNSQFVHSLKQVAISDEQVATPREEVSLSGRVLLAEDNHANQQLLSMLLRKLGAEVSIADNGEDAVEMALENDYDLIYMDMQMPLLSGVDAVKILRSKNYDQPIVALTANATNEDKMMCINAGCNDFLTKPAPRNKLYEMTSRYLQPSKPGEKISAPIISTLLNEDPAFKDLVMKFVTELPDMLVKLNTYYEQKDWGALKGGLHNLKGMGGGFGYRVLTELAGKAEFQVFSENYDTAKTLLDEINRVCDCVYEGVKDDAENVVALKLNSTR